MMRKTDMINSKESRKSDMINRKEGGSGTGR